MGILHRLVTSRYVNQTELVTTLRTFSNADINLTTGKGKTAFQLAVEVYILYTDCCVYSTCSCMHVHVHVVLSLPKSIYYIHNSGMIVIVLWHHLW